MTNTLRAAFGEKTRRAGLAAILLTLARSAAWGAPTVAAIEPADGGTVPVTAPVEATFSEALDPESVTTGSLLVSRFATFSAVAAGDRHTIALKKDGKVVA